MFRKIMILVFFSFLSIIQAQEEFGFSKEHIEDIQFLELKIELIKVEERKRKTFNRLAQGYKIVSEYYNRHEDNSTKEEIQVLIDLLEADNANILSIRKQEKLLKIMIAHKIIGNKNGR